MAEPNSTGFDQLERELTCAICTEILYQPLALLDCLHSFCGSCLKEWFTWQATSASQSRRTTNPFTCPSCRESVRGTKADWRLSTMLEGYLKANPDRAKSEDEKEEIRKHYKPGDEVMLSVRPAAHEDDGEDERIRTRVRDMGVAERETATRRRDRAGDDRRRQDISHNQSGLNPGEQRRRQQPSRWASQQVQLTDSRLRAHDSDQPHVEHQPSLRSLLSASDAEPQDVQAEILQSILNEGLLEGIDIDNLTPAQEDELTERIAEAYRRRQRRRERSSENRERRQGDSRSGRSVSTEGESHSRQAAQPSVSSASQQQTEQQSRSHPPLSRPHLFEQTLQEPSRRERRSPSSTSQRSDRSASQSDGPSPAARSATELSQQRSNEQTRRETRPRVSSTARDGTDSQPRAARAQAQGHRTNSGTSRTESGTARPSSSDTRSIDAIQGETRPANRSATSLPGQSTPPTTPPQSTVRPAISHAAFAPEPVANAESTQTAPVIKCDRCNRPNIQYDLHYNCPRCRDGSFNLCLPCYRDGKGCEYWFGFGARAFWRWYQATSPEARSIRSNQPHILSPRRFLRAQDGAPQLPYPTDDAHKNLQEGAFCESCFAFANERYWYCGVCLERAWGFCDDCVNRGRHCTHPLLAVAHISTVQSPNRDPSKTSFVNLPHLRSESYVPLPVTTGCDICQRPIPASSARFHCYQCNEGDYDICDECYRTLIAQGKISHMNGLDGWRRCLQGHRMAVIGYQSNPEGGYLRSTIKELVGGWRFKENDASHSSQSLPGGLPPDGGVGFRCLAAFNYFPREGVNDELAFPKNAEIREVEAKNDEWFEGVYAGFVKLFPSNHVRGL